MPGHGLIGVGLIRGSLSLNLMTFFLSQHSPADAMVDVNLGQFVEEANKANKGLWKVSHAANSICYGEVQQ